LLCTKLSKNTALRWQSFDLYGSYLYLNGFYSFDMNALLIEFDECIFFMISCFNSICKFDMISMVS